MSLHDRIKEARKKKGITQTELGELIGVAKTTVTGYEKNREPTAAQLGQIADVLDVDVSFLLQDEIKRRHEYTATPDEMEKLVKKYRALDDYAKGTVEIILDRECKRAQAVESHIQSTTPPMVETSQEEKPAVFNFPKAKKRHGMVEIEVYEQPAAAGLGNYLDEPPSHREQYPDVVIPSATDFGIIISGDSMEPKIHDGGTVFVQASISIDSGKIGIFILNGQAYCKRLEVDHDNRQIRLVSINKKYDDIVVGEYDTFRTVGQVLGQWTRGYANDDIFGW